MKYFPALMVLGVLIWLLIPNAPPIAQTNQIATAGTRG